MNTYSCKTLVFLLAFGGALAPAIAAVSVHSPATAAMQPIPRARTITVADSHAAYPLAANLLEWIAQKVKSPGRTADGFGASVAVSGNTAMIGAPSAGTRGHGAVYVLGKVNGLWSVTQKLTPSIEKGHEFGGSLALDGDTALIGDPGVPINGHWGAVYVFTRSNGTWSETQILAGTGVDYINDFGASVALADSAALIGAPDLGVEGGVGQAFIFTETGATWAQQQVLIPPDPDLQHEGEAVALNDQFAFIGAPDRNGPGNVYEYVNTNGSWQYQGTLAATVGSDWNRFGAPISLMGNTLLIGAPGADHSNGATYEFTRSGNDWGQTQKISLAQSHGHRFGSAIAGEGDIALISTGSASDKAVYVFSDSGGSWVQELEFRPGNPAQAGGYGASLAFDGSQALVGAPDDPDNPGSTYFYTEGNLGLMVSAPASVREGEQYVMQTMATNDGTTASAAVSATITVPAAASFVAATASQGSCTEHASVVTCNFGQIGGNAGTATANVTLKATGSPGATIENTASIAKATPPLAASAATTITAGDCPDGYSEYDGTLNAHQLLQILTYQAAAGEENAILAAPAGSQLYLRFVNGSKQKTLRIPGNEIHRQAPAGTYTWAAKAGDTGGTYTFCLKHP